MSFKMEGFGKLQKQLEDAGKAFKELDGEITTAQFNPNDQASVDAVIADVERAIDSKMSAYKGNPLVENVAAQLKAKYQEQILQRAQEAKEQGMSSEPSKETVDQRLFRQIENTVTDLRRAETSSFPRHISKLSRLLHDPALEPISHELLATAHLDEWLQVGNATQGGMVGSAHLSWPADQKEELGLVIALVDRFAGNVSDAIHFSHTFYYNGSSITSNLQNMVSHVIVPFGRDYIDYVKTVTGTGEAVMLPPRSEPAARKVFLVHGHDDGAREAVARFLEKIGFQPIILHEQANQGRTIIEKIEAHSDVGYAVVLLTPDDEGGTKGGTVQPRARQNVVLELGYFIGRLTRSRVCALKRGEVETPSDFDGIVYTSYDDNGGWKTSLGQELKAAGFEIDWNLVHAA